jgi:predicted transposase YbfD/YdcC
MIRTTIRQRHAGENPVQEMHYYLSSLPPEDTTAIGHAIRKHWDIENKCHSLLDVTYLEDRTLVWEIRGKEFRDTP